MAIQTGDGSRYEVGPWLGAAYGVVAGAGMVFAIIVARFAWDATSVTELAADWFTEAMPGRAIDFLLETLAFSAKPLLFAGLLTAQVVAGGLLGAAYSAVTIRQPLSPAAEWRRVILLSAALWAVSMAILVPVFGGGFFGSALIRDRGTFLLTTLGSYGVFGLALGYMYAVAGRHHSPALGDTSRRSFLTKAAGWTVALAAGGYGLKFIFDQASSKLSSGRVRILSGVLSTEVTPTKEFYIVSKNFIDPEVNMREWNLVIDGMVETPTVIEYEELLAMPSVEQYTTLECISNEVGGDLISNALWKGVPLMALLKEAGVSSAAEDVSFLAWDGYFESISMTMARRDEAILTYEMNGQPLTHKHGFPIRLLVPGYFGLKSVKWLSKIQPVEYDFKGYWQDRGWTDIPNVKTMSRFDTPGSRSTLPVDRITLGGVAFAGGRGIRRVEISDDDGRTWTSVEQISEPLSPYTWVIWQTEYEAVQPGRHDFLVRAVDGEGREQTRNRSPTIPDGATGLDSLSIEFVELPAVQNNGNRNAETSASLRQRQ